MSRVQGMLHTNQIITFIVLFLASTVLMEEVSDDSYIYNEGVQYANIAMKSDLQEMNTDDPEDTEWKPLNKQGQFARGSVLPLNAVKGYVSLVGGLEPVLKSEGKEGAQTNQKIHGCQEDDFGDDVINKFAILYRGKCKFEDKVVNAAKAKAMGVVVVNNQDDGVITMSIGDEGRKQNLISIMISKSDGRDMIYQIKESNDTVQIRIEKGDPEVGFEKVIVIVICLAFLVLLTISLAWVIFYYVQRFRLLHRQYAAQKRQEKLMRKALDSLRVESLKANSELVQNHDETCCAICIDNFEAGDEVRHLTCGHSYHKKCIDPWLMEKGTCPQCKVDILKQLGLRDSDTFAEPPADNPLEETNDAFYEEEIQQSIDETEDDNDSGVEDFEADGVQNGEDDHSGDGELCNSSQYGWFPHSQLNRAMSEPLPAVNQPNVIMRGVLVRNSQVSTVSEMDERQPPRTQF